MQIVRAVMFLSLLAVLASPGCVPDKPRLNSPPQGYSEPQHEMSTYYAYHNDQGMLNDMSLADIHFVPHSAELSATGEARLDRYAELLATSGGTINYDTKIQDPQLIRARINAANDYLKEAVPGTKMIKVAYGLAGGRGMTAAEAKSDKDVARQAEPRKTAYSLKSDKKDSSK